MKLYNQIKTLDPAEVRKKISFLLQEDMPNGDITTQLVINKNQRGKYILRARENMVFCGGPIIINSFSKQVKVSILVQEGSHVKKHTDLATLDGKAEEILTKERVVLNMVQHLSGISTNTAKYVHQLNNDNIKILDTRKTTPGLRLYEKYAVHKGGGHNHRLDLSSGIMIKDNHIAQCRDYDIYSCLKKSNQQTPIQVEIDNIAQITKENTSIVNAFLLDNMSPAQILKCVKKINHIEPLKNIFIEVSGGITLKNISQYNIKGIHGISIGALTHQSQSVDIGLDSN